MNKQPIYYMQTDPRWKNVSYSVSGEQTTIGESGCGPTSAAMILSTLTGKPITPIDTCKWALSHGYKALNQGTYYSYFVPQFRDFGLKCKQLNFSRILNEIQNPIHDMALSLLQEGYYLIALMGPGLWTGSGHYVVVWWKDDVYHICDPYSTKVEKLNGNITRFRNECRMYWAIDATDYNNKEDDDMNMDFSTLTDAQVDVLLARIVKRQQVLPEDPYAKEACIKGIVSKVFSDGNKDGLIDNPQGYVKRQELAVVLDRRGLI